VSIADLEGRLVYLNRAGRKMLGLDGLVDLTRYNFREFHDAANAHIVLTEGIPTAIRDGAWSGETELVALDGHAIAISQVILAHKKPDGTVAFLSTIARDITERRRAEESLRLQGAALHAAADAIVITDRAGVIEWVNPAFTQLTGYTAEEALGKTPGDLVKSGQHAPAFYQELWETILAGRRWDGEMINRRKDGRLYTEEQAITPIQDASGVITHFVAIKKGMTERMQLEAQLRQAQKMDSVGQLASGIAHDFNNLLTVINGMSDLLLTRVGQDDRVQADVQEIRDAGERAAALTRQLLRSRCRYRAPPTVPCRHWPPSTPRSIRPAACI
jgi:PAS domain S-box-containing protein